MSRLALAALLLTLSHSAAACGSLAPAEYRASVARDLRYQAQIVAKLASEADAVVVADVVTISDEDASVRIVEYLAGTGPAER